MKVAIIGMGKMGQRRAAALKACGDELVGAYDVGDAPDLSHADAVIVATTHDALADCAHGVMHQGKSVLVEKPVALTVHDVRSLQECAGRQAAIAATGYTLRAHRSVEAARNVDLGKPLYLRAVYGHGGRPGMENEWRCDPHRGGGELLDQGTHLIDLASHLLGKDLDEARVSGCLRTMHWTASVEDNAWIRLEWPDAVADLHASWTEPQPVFRVEVVHQNGSVELDGLGGPYGREGIIVRGRNDQADVCTWDDDGIWEREWRQVKERLANGCDDLEQARKVLRVVDAVRLSP